MRTKSYLLSFVLFLILGFAQADEAKTPVTFDGDVKAILNKRCAKCHTGDRPRGDLDLSTFGNVLQGGTTGKSVVAGKPGESSLYTMTAHIEEPKMPPNSPKIPQTEIDTIRKWIEGGLVEKIATKTGQAPPAATTSIAPAGGIVPAQLLDRRTAITAISVSPTSPMLALSGRKQVLLYELPNAKLKGALPFPEGEVHVLRFSRDGKTLLASGGVGGQSGALVGFDTATWKRKFTIKDNTDALLCADLTSDGKLAAFGGPSRLVKVAEIASGKILHTFRKPTDWVLSLAFSPDGLLVAAGDRFGGLSVWETNSGKEFYTLRGHTKAVTGLAWNQNGDALASASEDNTLRIWNLHSGSESAKWECDKAGVLDLEWSKNDTLLTAGREKFVRIWDTKGKLLQQFGPSEDVVLKISSAGGMLALGDWAGNAKLFPLNAGPVTNIPLPVKAKAATASLIAVPTPELPPTVATVAVAAKPVSTAADLERKRETLALLELSAERLKEEAARQPKNTSLAKAYLQVCEAVLAMKTEVVEAESQKVEPKK
jgi:WD40 repeat protein